MILHHLRFDPHLSASHTFLGDNGILAPEESGMEDLTRPFVDLWLYVERVGGFPGQVFFVIACIFVILGGLTWYGNRR
jgi:hypothetical protein